jgi:uncharacterized protein YdaU (DUF1376 family)
MAALPYMQLYVADYLADTAHLSTIEHGAYLLLIFNYWQRGESFKAKDEQTLNKRLASVARLSEHEWVNVKETLEEFFEISEFEWKHSRIERDLEQVNSKSAKASAAGKASANKRLTNVERSLNNRSTNDEQTLNHKDTYTNTEIKDKSFSCEVEEVFEFWKVTLSHEKAKLDTKRKKAIQNAIKLGYSLDDLKSAITGCSKTPHNMGQNDRGEKYDDISLILRDAGQIDRFIANSKSKFTPEQKTPNRATQFNEPARPVLQEYWG